MKTLMLQGGDLVTGANGHQTVTGAQMVTQDLRGALLEPVGTDRFHPGFGSLLDSMIGTDQGVTAVANVQFEAQRVVQQYVAIQRDRLERDALSGARSRYQTADIVGELVGISVRQNEDVMAVQVRLRTVDEQDVSVDTTVASG